MTVTSKHFQHSIFEGKVPVSPCLRDAAAVDIIDGRWLFGSCR